MSSRQKVNDKCVCGSGKKYKKCCKLKDNKENFKKSMEELQELNYNSILNNTYQNNIDKKLKECGNNFNKINNNLYEEEIGIHKYLPATSIVQSCTRDEFEEMFKHIKELHCKICGDTEKNSKILKIPTNIGYIILCDFCYKVQSNM
jgi:uncharacterized protein YecA (UPF0149 family)